MTRTVEGIWEIFDTDDLAEAISQANSIVAAMGGGSRPLMLIVARSPDGDFGVGHAKLVRTALPDGSVTFDIELLP